VFGSGPVRGFAVTVAIGTVVQMWTATVLTRLFVAWWYRRTRPAELPVFQRPGLPLLERLRRPLFRIFPDGTPCLEDQECSATASTERSELTVTGLPNGNPDAGLLTLSFDAGLALNCPEFKQLTVGTALFEVTGGRTKTATLEIDKHDMAAVPNNGASFLELCLGSPKQFVTKSGVLAVQVGTFDWNGDGTPEPVYRGVLPDCGVVAPPCVSKRQKTGSGDGVIQALLPAGDPAMRG